MVMRLAPIGAGAGVAFTIGKYGIGTLWSLAHLLIALYVTSLFFVVVVLGGVMRSVGLPFWAFLRFIREEIFVVLGTCSTEAVLPRMMQKLEDMGCAKPVVGLVLPTGYTFNARRHLHLPDPGHGVRRPGHQHPPDLGLADQLVILAAAADLERRGRRGGRGLHHPGRHPVDPARRAGQRPGACCWASTASSTRPGPSPT